MYVTSHMHGSVIISKIKILNPVKASVAYFKSLKDQALLVCFQYTRFTSLTQCLNVITSLGSSVLYVQQFPSRAHLLHF